MSDSIVRLTQRIMASLRIAAVCLLLTGVVPLADLIGKAAVWVYLSIWSLAAFLFFVSLVIEAVCDFHQWRKEKRIKDADAANRWTRVMSPDFKW